MTKMTEDQALKAAEELLAMYAQIEREHFEKEQHKVECFDIETGETIK